MKLYWFIEHFDPTRRVLEFEGGRNIVLTATHVEDLFLLPRKENVVELFGRNDDDEATHFLEKIKSRYGLGNKVNEKSINSFLNNNKYEVLQGGGADFKILFVIYAFSTFLAPTQNFLIELPLIKSLIDVDKISSFDWCTFIVERLCKALRSLKENKSKKNVNGCLLVLPLLYFRQFMWLGLPERSSLPLIKHWTSHTFTKRLDSEIEGGSKFGQGKWVEEGTYPISEKDKSPNVDPTEAPNHFDDVFDATFVSLDDIRLSEDHEDDKDQQYITYKLPRDHKNLWRSNPFQKMPCICHFLC